MNIKNIKERNGGYFITEQDGEELGRMTYSNAGEDKFIIDSTQVQSEYEGRGVGTAMVRASVDYARENALKIVPLCPFTANVFVKHKEFRDVLYK